MTAVPAEAQGCGEQPLDKFWDRVSIGWHGAFYGLIALTAVLVWLDGSTTSTHRAVAISTVAALGLWYQLFGLRGLRGPASGGRVPGLLYLAGLYAACWVVIGTSQVAYLLLFIAFPQTWGVLHRTGDALIGSAVLVAGLVVVMAGSAGWTGTDVATATLIGVVQLSLSGLLGLWINGITGVSQRQADLIRKLEATQAELGEVSHQAGVLAERERLAADIHDTLAQGFTSVLMLVQAADADLDGNPDQARRHLKLAEQAARENLAEARSLVAVLTPPTLDGGLPAALERLVGRFSKELGISSTVDIEGAPLPLEPSHEVVLLRATQEALANVRKHAGATSLAVTLTYGEVCTELIVRDNGRGFDPEQDSDGYGLVGMRTRLEQVGGSLAVDTAPQAGTTIRATVPA
jgi:signal transduction histidine kinase